MTTDKNLVRAASLAVLLLAVMLGFTASPDVLAEPLMQVQADPGAETQKAIEEAIGRQIADSNMGGIAVAIMGIIGVFIAPAVVAILIVWFWLRYKGRREQMKFETLKLMVEKGVPIPEQFSFMDAPPSPDSHLRRGLILIALGLGILVFFLVMGPLEAAGLAGIPYFIGLAYLLIWYIERNKAQQSDSKAG